MATFWYRVEILAGAETHCYFGTTQLGEAELLAQLGQGRYVVLEDLTYYDEEGAARPWTEWDPNYIPRIHLNPRYVVSIIPLANDPRKRTGTEGAEPVLLRYPGGKTRNEDN